MVIADLLIWLARPLRAFHKTVAFLIYPDRTNALLPAMMLFAAAYFTLLLPRTASDQTYDRYILPLMPCLLFPLLLKYQRRGDLIIPAVSWALLGFYAVVPIVFTRT